MNHTPSLNEYRAVQYAAAVDNAVAQVESATAALDAQVGAGTDDALRAIAQVHSTLAVASATLALAAAVREVAAEVNDR